MRGKLCGVNVKLLCAALTVMGAVPIFVMGPLVHMHEDTGHGRRLVDMHGRHHTDDDDTSSSSSSADASAAEADPESHSAERKHRHAAKHDPQHAHPKRRRGHRVAEDTSAGGLSGLPAEWEPVSVGDIVEGDMVGIRASDGRWVSRAYDTEAEGGVTLAEKTWQVHISRSAHHTFKSWCGTHLGLNRESKLVAQARAVSSEEKWQLEAGGAAGSVNLKGVGRDGAGKYVGLVEAVPENKGKGDLSCRYKEVDPPTTSFMLYKRTDCATPAECWGAFIKEKEAGHVPVVLGDWLGDGAPLFGSPKPFNKSDPMFAESHRSYTRLLDAWKALSTPIKPMMFVEPSDTIGKEATEAADVPMFHEFEHHKEFKTQPTYRGLFSGAFKRGKDLWGQTPSMVVYSNSDILYTSSLATSLACAIRFAKEKKAQDDPRVLVVGQRVNVNMPKGELDLAVDVAKLDAVLGKLATKGQKYQTNAEDYFAVSRGLFKWDKLPDFIVGGVAFDNWFVAKANRDANKQTEACVVDATDSVLAVHQNHGKGRKDSHLQPKSRYNRNLAASHGSWSKGRVVDARYATMVTPWHETVVVERRRLLFE